MARKKDTLVPVGKKIKQMRTRQKISLDYIANQTGFAIDYLKNLETGKDIPPVGALLQIARALKIDSILLLKEEQESINTRKREYTKRTKNYAYQTLTPDAENKHLKAFRVTVDPQQDHEGVGYQHEGEEFTYVLSGKIEIIVGDHVNTLGEGESLHFNSGVKHNLRNVGDKQAELLVIIFTP